MSYSIYYDRAFIRVYDKFIPLVNSGSNNCYQCKNGRDVPEKNWGILNWKHECQALFTETEIREIAKQYDDYNQESGMIYKSRYTGFSPGEFERWIVNGMKNAYTVEEYRSFGNSFYISDYMPQESNKWVRTPFSTSEELEELLAQRGAGREINIKMEDNRNVYRPVKHRQRSRGFRPGDLPEYYVIGGEGAYAGLRGNVVYLVKLRRNGIRYLFQKSSYMLKAFRTEREAERYIAKYESRLKGYASFKPVLVTSSQSGGIAS